MDLAALEAVHFRDVLEPHAVGIAVVMALAVPRIRLRVPVPVASCRARSLARQLRMWSR